ncbi:DUF4197 domain-containing protein [Fulvivirga sedimenti]|uniref:DUF4197 domain-containing protein n=1 Tax=Fulvivirga sedimenti TaxID=2879465 RepID=A0A9X1HV97_9BACT|nr:DUF4197 domain-containing protein [Fulvivirga sedimenti]MCA6075373.1 DUF4197 domain-containing protein [Fulvivirga sedimenti]MCA6076550.1 DUF4197 domain-containing protein [Fulvivirga sedimenti]MCA6077678.1 DUF4197 domain-containing protein [Fulvivirga sedimenti]
MKNYLLLFIFFTVSCTSAQINQTLGDINNTISGGGITESDVAMGLKEALIKGVQESGEMAGVPDGFLKRPEIKIPFPEDVQKVEIRLRQIGLGGEVDRFVESMNHGAEDAAALAVPIFERAVREMTVQDAWGILKGNDDAATIYLREKTSDQLYVAFKPVVESSLEKVNATRYYGDIINTYNKIPLVQKVDPDLNSYVTRKAMDGLFYLIAQEEKKIREDPLERTSDLLKKVFRMQD